MFEFTWFDVETDHWHIAHLPKWEAECCVGWANEAGISYTLAEI